jgi:lactoylglutathione lyase
VIAFREAFPILYADDVQRTVDFYVSTLGFEVAFRWPETGDPDFAFLRLEPLGIGIGRRHEHSVGAFELCVYADEIEAAAERLRAAGADEVMSPRREPWGEARAYFRDPDGHLIHVAAKL